SALRRSACVRRWRTSDRAGGQRLSVQKTALLFHRLRRDQFEQLTHGSRCRQFAGKHGLLKQRQLILYLRMVEEMAAQLILNQGMKPVTGLLAATLGKCA